MTPWIIETTPSWKRAVHAVAEQAANTNGQAIASTAWGLLPAPRADTVIIAIRGPSHAAGREVREISPRNADARLSVSTVSGMPVTTQTTPAI